MKDVLVAIPPEFDVKNGALLDVTISVGNPQGSLLSFVARTFTALASVGFFPAPSSQGDFNYVVPISPGLFAKTDANWSEVRLAAIVFDLRQSSDQGPSIIKSVRLGKSDNLIRPGE